MRSIRAVHDGDVVEESANGSMLDTARLHLILCGASCVGGDGEFASNSPQ
jgi:hypothetical protein